MELTSDTLPRLRSNICIDELPQTIADAILLCVKLGIHSLWVDALCILQNSRSDWHSEAASMSSIYGNALVTIKAAGSDNSHGGLFLPRNPSTLAPAIFRCLAPGFEDVNQATIYFREVSSEREPLETRAWTYQEDLLSPRTLTYGLREMWWECKSGRKSDGGRQVIESHMVSGLPKPLRTTRPAQFPRAQPDETATIRSNWLFILSEYGARNITYTADRLPALSGIAKVFQANLPGNKYLAGLWESHLPRNLLWHVSAPATRADDITGAPSWSWASVGHLQPGAYITFTEESRLNNVCCDYLAGAVALRSNDVYGQVESGVLQLRAPLLSAWRVLYPTESAEPFHKLYIDKAGYRIDLDRDRDLKGSSLYDPGDRLDWYEYDRLGKFNKDLLLAEEEGCLVETWLLFILSSAHKPGDMSYFCHGLVLERSKTDSRNDNSQSLNDQNVASFRRIGTFSGAYCRLPSYQTVFLV